MKGKYSIFVTAGTLDIEFMRLYELAEKVDKSEQFYVSHVQGFNANKCKVENAECFYFVSKNALDNIIENVDMIITHCGIGSLYTAKKMGKPAVVLPRLVDYGEHFDNHQLQIFAQLNDGNAYFKCLDNNVSVDNILDFFMNHKRNLTPNTNDDFVNAELQLMVKEVFEN
jgi:UDP-N-acetylglucosamine transferase subunit ALG13